MDEYNPIFSTNLTDTTYFCCNAFCNRATLYTILKIKIIIEKKELSEIIDCVEQSINTLVKEFIEYPYLHRVEHSLHARLFEIMKTHAPLKQQVALKDGTVTQLVHKEWPDNGNSKKRRGNFDICVLTPTLLAKSEREDFVKGKLNAPVVIEMGLNYNIKHLKKDVEKLKNKKNAYIIHLSRLKSRNEKAVETLIEAKNLGIKMAYVLVMADKIRYKHLNDKNIITKN
ncbi:MAG: hypothetical protein LBQ31_03080 [Bacteroidales bacterium]|jgi:hypothetical protein|nr:hypothetical protein [Bacteroidales bacterium]